MADVSVRPARPEDVGEIGRIQVDTWRTAYAEVLPAAVLEGLSPEAAAAAWAAAVSAPPTPRHHVLVALEQSWRVGFVALGPADDLETDDPEPASTVTLGPILVEPRWGRRGHGSRLLAAAADHARLDGMTRATSRGSPRPTRRPAQFLVSAGWASEYCPLLAPSCAQRQPSGVTEQGRSAISLPRWSAEVPSSSSFASFRAAALGWARFGTLSSTRNRGTVVAAWFRWALSLAALRCCWLSYICWGARPPSRFPVAVSASGIQAIARVMPSSRAWSTAAASRREPCPRRLQRGSTSSGPMTTVVSGDGSSGSRSPAGASATKPTVDSRSCATST